MSAFLLVANPLSNCFVGLHFFFNYYAFSFEFELLRYLDSDALTTFVNGTFFIIVRKHIKNYIGETVID